MQQDPKAEQEGENNLHRRCAHSTGASRAGVGMADAAFEQCLLRGWPPPLSSLANLEFEQKVMPSGF